MPARAIKGIGAQDDTPAGPSSPLFREQRPGRPVETRVCRPFPSITFIILIKITHLICDPHDFILRIMEHQTTDWESSRGEVMAQGATRHLSRG
jgi:hypothetical protein